MKYIIKVILFAVSVIISIPILAQLQKIEGYPINSFIARALIGFVVMATLYGLALWIFVQVYKCRYPYHNDALQEDGECPACGERRGIVDRHW